MSAEEFTQLELPLFPTDSWMWKDVEHIFDDVVIERHRQIAKWGVRQNHPDGTSSRWELERDIVRDFVNAHAEAGTLTWLHILREEVSEAFAETDPLKLRAELVQVAAVVFAWIEQLDGYPRWEPARQ